MPVCILWAAGRLREAADRFVRLLAIAPGDADALFNLGSLELALDDPGAAASTSAATSSARRRTPTGCCCSRAPGSGSGSSPARSRRTTGSSPPIPRPARAWFGRARLLLTVVEDPERGLADLRRALEAGFADKEAAAALVANESLLSREEVEKELADRGLLAAPAAPAAGP